MYNMTPFFVSIAHLENTLVFLLGEYISMYSSSYQVESQG